MIKNIMLAYKKTIGRTINFTRKSIKLPIKLKHKLKYVKIYAKAGMVDGLYRNLEGKVFFPNTVYKL